MAYGYIEDGGGGGFDQTGYAKGVTLFPLEEGVTYKVLVWPGVSPDSFDWRQAAEKKIPGEYFECIAGKTEMNGHEIIVISSAPFQDFMDQKVTDGWVAYYSAGDDSTTEGAGAIGFGSYAQCYLTICSSVEKMTVPVLQQIPAEYTTIKGGYDSYDILLDVVLKPDEFTHDKSVDRYVARIFQDLPLTPGQVYKVVVNDKGYSLVAKGDK